MPILDSEAGERVDSKLFNCQDLETHALTSFLIPLTLNIKLILKTTT